MNLRNSNMQDWPALDFLKFLAAILILQFHITVTPLTDLDAGLSGWRAVSARGWIGIDLILGISGYFLGVFWQGSRSASKYLLGRTLRLLPIYYIFLVLLSLYQSQTLSFIHWNEWFLLSNLPFAREYQMPWSWTISLEMQFAVIGAGLIFFGREWSHKNKIITVAGTILGLWILKILVFIFYPEPWNPDIFLSVFYASLFGKTDVMLGGTLCALMYGKSWRRWDLRSWSPYWLLGLGIIGPALILSPWDHRLVSTVFASPLWLQLLLMGPLMTISSASAIIGIMNLQNVMGARSFAPFTLFRDVFYPFYLIQIPLYYFAVRPLQWGWWGSYLLTAVLAFAVGYLVWIGIGRPFEKLRRRFLD